MTKAKARARANARNALSSLGTFAPVTSTENENSKPNSNAAQTRVCGHLRFSAPSCVRAGKRVAMLAQSKSERVCVDCVSGESEAPSVTHACLQCGQWRCAPHAQTHAQRLSKKHPVAAVLGTTNVHCFVCAIDTDVADRTEGAVRECFDALSAESDANVVVSNGDDEGDDDDEDDEVDGAGGADTDDVEPVVVLVPKNGKKKGNNSNSNGVVVVASNPTGPEVTNDQLRALLAHIDFANLSRGVVGLRNLGNTCYFNSVVQCLFQTPALRRAFLLPVFRPEPQLTRAFHALMLQAWSTRGTLTPRALLGEVMRKAPQFRGGRQQDAHELLRCLLDAMQDEEAVRIKALQAALASADAATDERLAKINVAAQSTNNLVRDAFSGELQSTVTCLTCLTPSVTRETFLDLGLAVGPATASPTAAASTAGATKAKQAAARRPRQMTKKQLKRLEKQRKQQNQQAAINAVPTVEGGDDDDGDEEEAATEAIAAVVDENDADLDREAAQVLYYATVFASDAGGESDVAATETTTAPAPAVELKPVDTSTAERLVRELDQRRAHLSNDAYPKDSLLAALATFTAPEVLTDAYLCDHCDELRRAVRQACILRAPETLTVCLKRFRTVVVGKSLEMVKFGGHVSVPTQLDLAPFAAIENSDTTLTYTLYGVVSHSGGNTRSGHYIALTRTEQGWTYFSDTVAKTSSESDATAAQAYLLFYRRNAAETPPAP